MIFFWKAAERMEEGKKERKREKEKSEKEA